MNKEIQREIYKTIPELNPQDPRSPNYSRKLNRNNNIIKELKVLLFECVCIYIFRISIMPMVNEVFFINIINCFLIIKYPISRTLIIIVKVYQNYAPSHIRNKCRFEPSCSHYAINSFEVFFLPVALYKTIRRLFLCSQINAGGFEDYE